MLNPLFLLGEQHSAFDPPLICALIYQYVVHLVVMRAFKVFPPLVAYPNHD